MGENPYQKDKIEVRSGEDFFNGDNGDNGDRQEETPKKGKPKRSAGRYVVAVLLALACFLLGGATTFLSLDPQIRTLIKVKQAIDGQYYEKIDDETFYRAIFQTVNEDLLDDYSLYMTAEEFAAQNAAGQGLQIGLGLVFRTQDENGNDCMFIDRVCGNSPAEAAGIAAGSYVVGFGKTQDSMIESEKFGDFSAFLQEYGEGEKFYVKLQKGEDVSVKEVAKSQYVENYVFYRTNKSAWRFEGATATTLVEKGEPLACLDEDTAYLRLTQFNGEAVAEFKGAMKLFQQQNKKNLILDLRENGGGYLDIMQEISSYFCKGSNAKKPIVAVAEYQNKKEKYAATGNWYDDYFKEDSRVCVLADGGTASASECLIGCMIDYGVIDYGDICLSERNGTAKTFGKGIMQTTYPFIIGGDAIKLTTAKIVWPISGNCIHGVGILPSDGALTVKENVENDAEIAAAVEKLFF
ncbi:MAG: hypothetical protein IJX87_03530 [Clostridia bacterium]|nr:hypothetical protein [Clostridia bacterium]